jgi:hypothetical protein
LVEGFLHGWRASDRSEHPDGEKLRIEAAFAHAGDIHVAVRMTRTEIEFPVEQALRGIGMGIQDDGGKVQFVSALGDVVGRNGAYESISGQQKYSSQQTNRAG